MQYGTPSCNSGFYFIIFIYIPQLSLFIRFVKTPLVYMSIILKKKDARIHQILEILACGQVFNYFRVGTGSGVSVLGSLCRSELSSSRRTTTHQGPRGSAERRLLIPGLTGGPRAPWTLPRHCRTALPCPALFLLRLTHVFSVIRCTGRG